MVESNRAPILPWIPKAHYRIRNNQQLAWVGMVELAIETLLKCAGESLCLN